ncbi:MAG: sulfite exporter TauE/SafE family protein [Coriobacteriia bacterium]|nr:sulfite exporter TauE/SafE family protein [Coriobacteriia bacterium]
MDMGHVQMSMAGLSSLSLWGAFLLGLTGGFGHCLAMCGPFVAAASVADGAAALAVTTDGTGSACSTSGRVIGGLKRSGVFQLAYHLGRLGTYALIGLLLGLLGEAGALVTLGGPFSPTAVTQWLKVAAGVTLLAMGALMAVAWMRGRRAGLVEPTAWLTGLPWFGRAVSKLSKAGGWAALPLGALMGLLPCAPLVPVEIAALASGAPLFGMLTMLAFGLGTVPALAGFGAATGLLGASARGWFAPAAAFSVVVLGGVTLYQGLAVAGAL